MGLLGEDRDPAAVASILRFCPGLNKVLPFFLFFFWEVL